MTGTAVTQNHEQRPALRRGRLMFALDATASRAPTWAIARDAQADMFRAAAPIGYLDVQLVYYRAEECRASKWASTDHLAHLMHRIECQAGYTQISRVLAHAIREAEKASVQALIFIGDAMEEQIEELAAMAGKLGTLGVPAFLFQEGRNPAVRKAFRLLALKSGGAYFEFNPNAAQAIERLSDQLGAIARLAVGDAEALQQIGAPTSRPERRHDR
jgi:hypothetical protein